MEELGELLLGELLFGDDDAGHDSVVVSTRVTMKSCPDWPEELLDIELWPDGLLLTEPGCDWLEALELGFEAELLALWSGFWLLP